MMMYEQNDIVIVPRERFAELERKEERIEAVKRLYESGNCYTLDTALTALGIKIRGSEKIALHGDPCEDDLK
jgi:hypothetical protein